MANSAQLDRLSDAELLSLAADGELPVEQTGLWHRATAASTSHDQWVSHLFVGDALRSASERPRGTRTRDEWMSGLRSQLSSEDVHAVIAHVVAPVAVPVAVPVATPDAAVAPLAVVVANDRFWKLVAGVSSFASVGAVAFALTVGLSTRQTQTQVSDARAGGSSVVAGVQPILVSTGGQVMIRDPRLMERIAQHRQFGSNGVHASTAFLRNATFESNRCPNGVVATADC